MKTVVITGVSRGLGLATGLRLVADGFKVVGLSLSLSAEYQALMESAPEQVVFLSCDVTDLSRVPNLVPEINHAHGPVFGLVNNAGIGLDGVLAIMHQTDIEAVIRTNLLAPIALTKYFSRMMLSHREGRIVNISSIVASTGFNGLSVYAATKAGLEGFTRSLGSSVN
jgi:3-oxoacyl-[acyl-carrier protein] reductase